jgi:hypothetical protein
MNCKNCQTELLELDDYCRSCGGRVIRKRLTFKNLFEHLSETFFNYDNKLLRTFNKLFTQPEDVIGGYIDGVRKKYINPISFFGLALTITGLSIFIIKKFYLDALDFSGVFGNMNVPDGFMDSSMNGAMEYNSLFYSLLVPLFAFVSWIIFLDKSYNLTEHIIIYLYSMSLLSVVSVIIGQIFLFVSPNNYMIYGLLMWPLMFLYHCYILKRIFKLSFGGLILKSFLAVVLFFVLYMIISVLTVVIMFATGALNLEDFAPK